MTFCCFCLDCDCTFKGRCKLREHLRSHTQEKVVACPTCGGMFANNTKFFDHIRRQTALDRKLLRAGEEWVVSCPLAGPSGLLELPVLCEQRAQVCLETAWLLDDWELRH